MFLIIKYLILVKNDIVCIVYDDIFEFLQRSFSSPFDPRMSFTKLFEVMIPSFEKVS